MRTSLTSRAVPPQSLGPATELPLTGTSFVPGGEFTVGAEEELLLIDASNQLAPADAGLISRVQTGCLAAATVSAELYAAEIEFGTAVCQDGEAVRSCLTLARTALDRTGARAIAAGVHPDGRFGDTSITSSARYDLIGATLAGLLRTPTAALQVHVGLPDAPTAITAYRALRHHLAVLRALSASSPFWHGRDSGLVSARWAVISSYPRSGVPPVVKSWEEYVVSTEAVAAAAEVPDYTHVWWDLRIQPRLGTIEVRAMDAQASLGAAAGFTALIQGLVRYAVERPRDVDLPTVVLAENDFRVARHGLETTIADVDGTMRPVRHLATDLIDHARSVLDDRQTAPLAGVEKILADEPSYVRQRRIHAEGGVAAVLADLVARTKRGW